MSTDVPRKSGFDVLPNELVISIIERMPNDNAKDICNLSLTSRRMYTLSVDHLYQSLLVRRPWPLLRTLWSSPELANRVRDITWRHNFNEHDDTEENQAVLSNCMKTLELSRQNGLICDVTGLQRDHEFIEILLMFTPHLRTLVVADRASWPDGEYWFKTIANNPARFMHLRSINIHGPLSVEAIAYLFLLPSLRDLIASDLIIPRRTGGKHVWDKEIPLRTVLDPGSSQIEKITLKRSVVEVPTLKYFTEACRELKSFAYEQDINNDQRSMYPQSLLATFGGLSAAFILNRTTLEHLSIRGDHQMLHQVHVLQVARLASSMSNLRSLDMGLITHDDDPIQCTSDFVAKMVRLLPATLEEMSFEVDWQEHWGAKGWEGPTEMLRCLADIAPSKLSLKRVSVVDWPPFLGHFPPDFAQLHQCFAEQKIDFISIPANIEGPDPLQLLDFVEPGWVFVQVAAAEYA
ncbi:uncharacterized protein ALTATR162_LOCUS8826 [Alternaria atra]|uniref:F-box domain-containing protein n=1 Tax=Alternaria atra TaxID=119953 RepID=A0A8J2I7L8_9PLEO|nr:uncharacterized protein ALTATR162_LOCUS8826 [Alternaria atra]CAG5178688.1 unnamed protein product [Alternaria atra]